MTTFVEFGGNYRHKNDKAIKKISEAFGPITIIMDDLRFFNEVDEKWIQEELGRYLKAAHERGVNISLHSKCVCDDCLARNQVDFSGVFLSKDWIFRTDHQTLAQYFKHHKEAIPQDNEEIALYIECLIE